MDISVAFYRVYINLLDILCHVRNAVKDILNETWCRGDIILRSDILHVDMLIFTVERKR